MEIDHIRPSSRGGTDDEDNLWLACAMCNRFKGAQESGRDPISKTESPLYNPRQQDWSRHFMWSGDGLYVVGLTQCGRATVAALQLNNTISLMVRREWIAAGWHPPSRTTQVAE